MTTAHKLNLVPDGRDIARLVDVMGNEIRTASHADGRLAAVLVAPGCNNEELDTFTQSEWDDVLTWGRTFDLDKSAGTTYTIINW